MRSFDPVCISLPGLYSADTFLTEFYRMSFRYQSEFQVWFLVSILTNLRNFVILQYLEVLISNLQTSWVALIPKCFHGSASTFTFGETFMVIQPCGSRDIRVVLTSPVAITLSKRTDAVNCSPIYLFEQDSTILTESTSIRAVHSSISYSLIACSNLQKDRGREREREWGISPFSLKLIRPWW